MSEQELIDLSNGSKTELKQFSQLYGYGIELKKYGLYPNLLPLPVHCNHGITFLDYPVKTDLENGLPVMLVFSERMQKIWLRYSKKPCYVVKNPFAIYKDRNNIKKDVNAKGSVFFFSHSTAHTNVEIGLENIIYELEKLPEKFKPITICFYYLDILKGAHKYFMDRGFECVTAGNPLHPDFIKRFYNIIKSRKYGLSNSIGSHLFYLVDLGLPFSLIGNPPIYKNISDPNFNKGVLINNSDHKSYVIKLFTGLFDKISPEQKELVNSELGLKNSIGRLSFIFLIYKTLLFHSMNKILNRKI
ncbi:hypothetical protein [Flexithrix dorotheae]|uniref:hypothetical protein n=1 Tax=Flexithrix dorotheae TaxID=70993 RepID=UPI00035E0B1B|nr:hypothetical protein [Flexithrix dorotheae]